MHPVQTIFAHHSKSMHHTQNNNSVHEMDPPMHIRQEICGVINFPSVYPYSYQLDVVIKVLNEQIRSRDYCRNNGYSSLLQDESIPRLTKQKYLLELLIRKYGPDRPIEAIQKDIDERNRYIKHNEDRIKLLKQGGWAYGLEEDSYNHDIKKRNELYEELAAFRSVGNRIV